MRPASVNLLLGEAIGIDSLPRILPGSKREICEMSGRLVSIPRLSRIACASVIGIPGHGNVSTGGRGGPRCWPTLPWQGHAQRLTIPRIHARVCVERMRADE